MSVKEKALEKEDALEILAYYLSYGKEAPEEVKVSDIITISTEYLRLRELLEELSILNMELPGSDEKMKNIIKRGIGKGTSQKI